MKASALTLAALAAHVHGAWTHDSSYDDFEGVTRVTASVAAEGGEPYGTASFTFRCTDDGMSDVPTLDAYFTFGYLNRVGVDTAPLRVKFGDDPPHDWPVRGMAEGYRGLFMQIGEHQIEKLAAAESFRVRLAYIQEVGPTTITFPMAGARESIAGVLESACGENAMSVSDQAKAYWALEQAYTNSAIRCAIHAPLPRKRHLATSADEQAWKNCMRNEGVEPCSRTSCGLLAHKGTFGELACKADCAGPRP